VEVYTSLPKGCTFYHPLQVLLNWRIYRYRYHCKLQTTEYELTWYIHNYVWGVVISKDPRAVVGQGMQFTSWAQWKLIKSKKIITNCSCFCSATVLTSKIITKITENHSESSGCANQVDLCKQWNAIWYCYEKAPIPPLPPS